MLLASVLAFSACKGPDLGFAIAVTVRLDDSVDAAGRASLTSLHVTSAGDEKGEYDEALSNGASEEERFVYRPSANTRTLELAIAARTATATVADGTTGKLTLSPGETTTVEVLLRAPGSGDGGVDGMPGDASGPVDLLAFEHADRYPGCVGAMENALGDFDGDGHTDVALVCKTSGNVQVYLGKADATFPTSPSTTTTVLSPTSLAAVDFDADMHLDLVVVSSDGVHLLKNDGTAKFTDIGTRALTGATTVSVADFDKDGPGDLLVSGSPTEVRVMWGTGVGTSAFSSSAALTVALTSGQTMAVDLDNDGYLDVVAFEVEAGSVPGKVESFHNNQASMARTFASPVTLDYSSVRSGVFQDINNDGKPEGLFSIGAGGGYGFAVWSNTNGVLAPANGFTLYSRPTLGGIPATDMLLVDIDHDKVDDLVVVSSTGSYVTTYKGLGPLQFDTSPRPAYWVGGGWGHMHHEDLDKDGFEDLVLIDGDGFVVVRGAAAAKLHAPEVFTFGEADNLSGPWIGDLDKDGDLDFAILDYIYSGAYAYTNDGKGHMMPGPGIPITTGSCSTAAVITGGDVNKDGFPDLIRGAAYCYDTLLGAAGGTLTEGPGSGVLMGGEAMDAAALADLDGDDKLDLVWIAGNWGVPQHIRVSLGVGDGSFAAPTDVGTIDPRIMRLADANHDGHIDILITSPDNTVSIFLNNGKAVFGMPTKLTGPSGLSGMEVFDYDEDDVLDLVLAGNVIYQYKGPTFSDAQRSSRTLVNPWQRMTVGDVNRDGHLDLVGASTFGIEVLTGNGTIAFAAAHSFSFPSTVSSLQLADLDGDKLPELVIVGPRPGAAILRNISR